ncbi:LOW QUALITY PROTEIN: hypothetical protein HID58_005927, partial [Brassica napus]
ILQWCLRLCCSVTTTELGLLRDQVQLIKRKDSGRYEIGFYAVIRACQLLAQKNDGLILVGLAGPSGAGKTVFTEKILNFMPSIAIINMDNYNDGTRVIDGTLMDGKSVQVPIYDFKSSSRIGYRTLEVPSSRIVILEGIYALSEKLRPFLDLRVSVTGGVHFDLVKRVLRDIQRAGQEPEKSFIKYLRRGFQNPTYILKSTKAVTPEQMKAVLSEDFKERTEETYDIYLLPPGEDPEACQSYLRMRNRDGNTISCLRITFEVSVRLLGGLMGIGHIFDDEKVQGRDRSFVENVATNSDWKVHIVHIHILNRYSLPDDLKTKLSLDDDTVSSPKEALRASADIDARAPASPATLPNQGVITQLSDQISTLNERMDDFTSPHRRVKLQDSEQDSCISQHNLALPMENGNGSLLSLSSSQSQLVRESPLMEEVILVARGQRQIMHQMDTLSNLLREYVGERSRIERLDSNRTNSTTQNLEASTLPVLLALVVGCLGVFAYSRLK